MDSGKRAGNESRRGCLKTLAALGGACLTVGLLGGCSTTHWRSSKTVQGYVPPGHFTLVLKFGPKVDPAADDGGNASAMIDSLTEELAKRGLGISAGEVNTQAYPRLTLTILESYKGNRALSYLVAPAWNPAMIVVCEVVMAEGRAPSFIGEVRGTLLDSTSDSTTGGESIGRAIAEAISEPTAFD